MPMTLVVKVARKSARLAIGKVRIWHALYSDVPGGPVARPGIYDGWTNSYGAVSIELRNHVYLGVKPHEYEPI